MRKIREAIQPTANVAEVVRCKECRHKYFKDMSAYCPHKVGPCAPDFFCGYGEKEVK